MAVQGPTWSYGKSKLFTSSGTTPTNDSDEWVYGKNTLFHEFVAAGAGTSMPVLFYHHRQQRR